MSKIYTYFFNKYNNLLLRQISTGTKTNLKNEVVDKIGPPDSISQLRPIIFAKPKNETQHEKRFREAREDTQNWNQNFWRKHNSNFTQERKQYQETLKTNGKSVTADEMSIFYKQFLDKNWKTHLQYNISWYKRNFKLLLLEIRVRITKLKFK